jgi:hypothetical protein
MSTDSGDTARTSRPGDEAESVKVTTDTADAADTTDTAQSPYDIGVMADEDETGPKPLRTDLEDEQVRDER